MLRALKYLFLANLYKKAKSNVVMLLIYTIALLLISFIMNDFISVSENATAYFMLLLKWVIVLTLLVLIGFKILKIINIASKPFGKEEPNERKRQLLSKKDLLTQSDRIMQKYIKD